MVSHLLDTHATGYNITEMDSEIASFLKLRNTSLLKFANEVCPKTFKDPLVHDQYVFKEILVEGFLQSTRHNRTSIWSCQKTELLQNVAYNENSSTTLKTSSRAEKQMPMHNNSWRNSGKYQSSQKGTIFNMGHKVVRLLHRHMVEKEWKLLQCVAQV